MGISDDSFSVPSQERIYISKANQNITSCEQQTFSIIMSAPPKKRRKIDSEGRVFQDIWTELYFFVKHNNNPVCLICQESIAGCKEFNLRRHYETKHKTYSEITGQIRKDKIIKLKANLQSQSSIFTKKVSDNEKSVQLSYELSELIAQDMKPFSDGEFIKKCIVTAVNTMCPDKSHLFSNVSMSRRTVTRRIEDMASDIKQTFGDYCQTFQYFSIALDESTDEKDTAQLAIFVRGVTSNIDVHEEFVQLVPLKDTTTGADVFKATLKCLEENKLDLSKLVSVTTDGAPAMVGVRKGFVSLLQKHMKEAGHQTQIIRIHCIIHQEALCAKSLEMQEIMKVVVKVVNLILSRGLNHRQFQQLLLEVDAQHSDLLYFCEVRWLSRGKMLDRFFELLKEINEFLVMKNIDMPQLRDPVWIANLAFLVDITAHLNDLNLKLQGRNQLVSDLFSYVAAFERKLNFLKGHIEKSNFKHFPTLQKLQPSDTTIYEQFMSDLIDQFSSRFEDIRTHQVELKLFATPFDVDVDIAPEDIQMELIDLQSNIVLRSKHGAKDISILDFYQKYLAEDGNYPNLVENAKKMTSIFGSTYICEQLFSKMKLTKSKLRTKITDSHLDGILRITASSLKPNIKKLVQNKSQYQTSH